MKALINASIYDFKNYGENKYIIFDNEIVETGEMRNFRGAEEVIDCSGCIVMPGLTNCHTHVYSALSRGMNMPFNPLSFRDILEQLWWKLDRELDIPSIDSSGLVYGLECIKNGVTSVVDHHASGLAIRGTLEALRKSICDEVGLRGVFCFETSDRFNLDECISENLDFSRSKTESSCGIFGLHASMSLSSSSLQKVYERIGNLPIHIHVGESMDDVEDCEFKYGMKIIERLERIGLLKPNSLLAHCVHITKRESELIAQNGCYVALNPSSNMNNAVGLPDYGMLKSSGVKCLIGNDGLGANVTREYLNIVYSMKNRMGSPVKFTLEDLADIINNGYEYINKILNVKIGRIERGYKADLITVPYLAPTPIDSNNILAHIFYGAFDNFHPRDVWISGNCRQRNYRINLDVERALNKAKEEAVKVWERVLGNK